MVREFKKVRNLEEFNSLDVGDVCKIIREYSEDSRYGNLMVYEGLEKDVASFIKPFMATDNIGTTKIRRQSIKFSKGGLLILNWKSMHLFARDYDEHHPRYGQARVLLEKAELWDRDTIIDIN